MFINLTIQSLNNQLLSSNRQYINQVTYKGNVGNLEYKKGSGL